MPRNKLTAAPGDPQMAGATRVGNACNFTVEADADASVSLLIYRKNAAEPEYTFELGEAYRTGRLFSARITPFDSSLYEYNYSINGTVRPDPCARRMNGLRQFGVRPENSGPHAVRCGFLSDNPYAWHDGDYAPPRYRDMILYKVHVRGYTRARTSLGRKKGTFAGLTQMIPYWTELGINALELMPAYEFDEFPRPKGQENTGFVNIRQEPTGRVNYWGYGPGQYFSPKQAYCAGSDPEAEVCALVDALHQAGIACIMEFYFPAGTTPLTVLQILHFWRMHYHIDGFHLLGDGVPLNAVLQDALLADTLIMATGADPGILMRGRGGKAPVRRVFAEYNAGFLEDMRRFLKSDEGMVEQVKYRLGRTDSNYAVINFMAYQDGFTLMDAVSYNYKHNEANGEENHDGSEFNYSWNCGTEGPTRRQAIRQLRQSQICNAFAMVLFAQEVPMIYGGDEFGNSQDGNNNAYCQDNPTGWVDWKAFKKNEAIYSFVRQAIAFRKAHPVLHLGTDVPRQLYQGRGFPVVSFHGERAWFCSSENYSRLLGVMYSGPCALMPDGSPDDYLYVAYNFHWEERELALPNLPGPLVWKKVMDTAAGPDQWDFSADERMYEKILEIAPRSIVVLMGVPGPEEEEARDVRDSVHGSEEGFSGTPDGEHGSEERAVQSDGLRGSEEEFHGTTVGMRGAEEELHGTTAGMRGTEEELHETSAGLHGSETVDEVPAGLGGSEAADEALAGPGGSEAVHGAQAGLHDSEKDFAIEIQASGGQTRKGEPVL